MESGNVKLLLSHEEMRSKHRVVEIVFGRHSKNYQQSMERRGQVLDRQTLRRLSKMGDDNVADKGNGRDDERKSEQHN